ncbi:hypothetical protein PTQ19_03420 [Microbacterium esteraromaticum]|uniref:hypothetical protein n=1 Tax=Microbacterium esteraromaticum TaxID=57043 RepID=UPI002368143A|nr:hypothetical protein [Microbacterium esteraromaticum]WDH79505.1 hypothetical protein PTQ19_03420 [Microbacterium esteraromaticum]
MHQSVLHVGDAERHAARTKVGDARASDVVRSARRTHPHVHNGVVSECPDAVEPQGARARECAAVARGSAHLRRQSIGREHTAADPGYLATRDRIGKIAASESERGELAPARERPEPIDEFTGGDGSRSGHAVSLRVRAARRIPDPSARGELG